MASNRLHRLLKIITGTNTGAEEELLQLEGHVERALHFVMLVWRHFVRNLCLIRSLALAYTTLLALVPLLAVVISISSSLLKNQDEDRFYRAIASIMPPADIPVTGIEHPHPVSIVTTNFVITDNITNEVVSTNRAAASTTNAEDGETTINAQKELAHWLHHLVQNTENGTLGVTGMLVFVFIAISMLSRIEDTFNDIWGVTRGRNWLTRIVLYWAAITLGPILVLLAMSITGSSHFQSVKEYCQHLPIFGKLVLELVPLLLLWFTFCFIYQIVPNTKVRFPAAFVGGAVAGTAWHLNNVFGFLYVSRAIAYSKLYGGLFLIPVFMLGLYFSWVILLFGAQLAYAVQNRAAYLQDRLAHHVNQRGREFVALRIMIVLCQRFQNGLRPATVPQLSSELGVPSRLTQQILRILGNAQLVTEICSAESAYVPARPLENITAHDILLALRSGSGRDLPGSNAPELSEIYGEFGRIEAAERAAAEKISMFALIHRQSAALAAPVAAEPQKPLVDIPVMEDIRVPEMLPVCEDEPSASEVISTVENTPEPAPEKASPRPDTVRPEERDFPL